MYMEEQRKKRFIEYEKNLYERFKRNSTFNMDNVILKVCVQEEPTIYHEVSYEVDLNWKPKIRDELGH